MPTNFEKRADKVFCDAESLSVILRDGRTVAAPLSWYPRIAEATPQERANCELQDDGEGILWPDIDEEISVKGILAGRRSGESEKLLAQLIRLIKLPKMFGVNLAQELR